MRDRRRPAGLALLVAAASLAGCGTTTAAVVAPPPTTAPTPVDTSAHQSQSGSLKSGHITRVVWARADLTGQRELNWVAGGVQAHGDASCTQRFQLGNEKKPGRKDTLLLCWRTSPHKSVIVILVDVKGAPSQELAVSELDAKWDSLG